MYELAGFCMNGQFQLGQITPWRYFLAVAVVVGLVLGLTTPDEDEPFSITAMLAWQIQSLVAMGMLVFFQISFGRLSRYRQLGPWGQLILSGLAACLVIAPVYLLLDIGTGLNELPESAAQWRLAITEEILGFTPPILLTWVAINAPFCLGYQFVSDVAIDPSSKETDTATNTSRGILPLSFTETAIEDIQYIKAELHYIKVVTADNSELILYNLKDAVSELPETAGAMCHRSYWVNYAAIVSYQKQGRQGKLTLNGGEEIPVSRQHATYFSERHETIK